MTTNYTHLLSVYIVECRWHHWCRLNYLVSSEWQVEWQTGSIIFQLGENVTWRLQLACYCWHCHYESVSLSLRWLTRPLFVFVYLSVCLSVGLYVCICVCGQCRCCAAMRQCRPMMVRCEKQYKFIYEVLFDALLTYHALVGDDVNVSYRLLNRLSPHTGHSYFHDQFQVTPQLHTYNYT